MAVEWAGSHFSYSKATGMNHRLKHESGYGCLDARNPLLLRALKKALGLLKLFSNLNPRTYSNTWGIKRFRCHFRVTPGKHKRKHKTSCNRVIKRRQCHPWPHSSTSYIYTYTSHTEPHSLTIQPVFLPHWTTSTLPPPVISPVSFTLRNLRYDSCKSQGKLKNCQTERHNHMIPDPRLGTFARSHWDNRQNLNRISKWRGFEGSLTILLPMCFWKIKLLWFEYKCLPQAHVFGPSWCHWGRLWSL